MPSEREGLDGLDDAALALQLFVRDPLAFGGMVLRGDGPARDAMADYANAAAMAADRPVRRLPANLDIERLLGGIDLTATLARGARTHRAGLLDEATVGVLIVPMAERMRSDLAAPVAEALDRRAVAAILLDDGREADDLPLALLSERMAFLCDVSQLRGFDPLADNWPKAMPLAAVRALDQAQRERLAAMATALGVASMRALVFADRTARAHAALHGRLGVEQEDIDAAARLVLGPRATRLPAFEPAPEPPPEPHAPETASDPGDTQPPAPVSAEETEILLEAALAAIPPHVLDQIASGRRKAGSGQGGRAGERQSSARRGRPLRSRPGMPGHGRKLALIDSLRAAAPWQAFRRAASSADDMRTIHVRSADLRVRHYEQRSESLTIFAVDASGSSALSRLAEAKGAVELLLAQAYVKRTQVALVAFRQTGAEVILPPTRSLTRARRALAALPGGGGTPLAAGLLAAQQLADAARKRGQDPTLAVLTDGKANVLSDGTANRDGAMAEARQAAQRLAASGVHSVVIDISPRPRPEAAELAAALGGRYLPLPYAQSAALVAAIEQR